MNMWTECDIQYTELFVLGKNHPQNVFQIFSKIGPLSNINVIKDGFFKTIQMKLLNEACCVTALVNTGQIYLCIYS